MATSRCAPIRVTARLLRDWPLPRAEEGFDKEGRGRVLAIGGAIEMPGAIYLAALASLRVGAGKLQIATCKSVAPLVAMALPESRVVGLPETRSGGIAPLCAAKLVRLANRADAVIFGPGMIDDAAVHRLAKRLIPAVTEPVVVVDAAPLSWIRELAPTTRARLIVTPHAGEAASMMKMEKRMITQDRAGMAVRLAHTLGAVVALKGARTFIADPSGTLYENRAGNVGLATSGSGDTLSGIIGGLAARGTPPLQSAVWGVHLHAKAGEVLAARMGPLGFLARELLAEIPNLLARR